MGKKGSPVEDLDFMKEALARGSIHHSKGVSGLGPLSRGKERSLFEEGKKGEGKVLNFSSKERGPNLPSFSPLSL